MDAIKNINIFKHQQKQHLKELDRRDCIKDVFEVLVKNYQMGEMDRENYVMYPTYLQDLEELSDYYASNLNKIRKSFKIPNYINIKRSKSYNFNLLKAMIRSAGLKYTTDVKTINNIPKTRITIQLPDYFTHYIYKKYRNLKID
jgi:hypothetical protein